MTNMTLSIPDTLERRMRRHPEMRWSEVARQAFEQKLNDLELLDKLLAKSELTDAEAEEIGHGIKREMWKRFA